MGLRGDMHRAHTEGAGRLSRAQHKVVRGMAGVAGQWQYAGTNAGKQGAAGLVARLDTQLRSRSCGEFVHRAVCGECAVHADRSHGPLLVLLR